MAAVCLALRGGLGRLAFALPAWAPVSVGRVPLPAPRAALGCRLRCVPFVVGFLVGFLCVAFASFFRLGWLFSVLGQLFRGLGCLRGVSVFCIFVSCSGLPLRLQPRGLRRCPLCVSSGGLACSVGLRWRSRVSRCRLGSLVRSASPRLALGLPLGSAAIWVALGGSAGRWLALAPRLSACRSARAVSPLLAFSCLCFVSFF